MRRAYLAPVLGGEEPTVPAAALADAGVYPYPDLFTPEPQSINLWGH